ncbi:hypothetical protein DB43_HK00590 [Parachlamydia acanthamoebae]|uniref:Uncharacterized protein n=1 Tax=Parachlamydia acanthamoebae TaxID=83552 RepID=A0A0C1BZD2_9BACT|nr:hypothetical protein DB43_HK00590 [Parachlamydia acanthamoebae]
MLLNKTLIILLIFFMNTLSKNFAYGDFQKIEMIRSELGDDGYEELKKLFHTFSKTMRLLIPFWGKAPLFLLC